MGKTILFSPVGGTDPISATNCHDGALLHISRVYRPDKVILYMSKEMLAYHESDNRYLYCLDKLCELQKREKMEYEIIERRELTRVQEFDFFYQDFRKEIERVMAQMEREDTLLINISSGTPAMKSGLLVLKTLGEFPCHLIQVSTPMKKMNNHVHDDFDVFTAWEVDPDNEEGFENRCKEVFCPSLSQLKNEEIIKEHIAVYDYQAALAVAEKMPAETVENYKPLLEMATRRIFLDFAGVDQILREHPCFTLPIRDGDKRKYYEYALGVEVKLRRKEYVEFIRSITPLIVDLFELILENRCQIRIDDYCVDTVFGRKWDFKKLEGTSVKRVLDSKYSNGLQGADIKSDHLCALIQHNSQEQKLKELAQNLRNVEKKIRNLAAHEIISITDRTIQEKTGFTGEQILGMLKTAFAYTTVHVKQEEWNSYDQLNEQIIQAMKMQERQREQRSNAVGLARGNGST